MGAVVAWPSGQVQYFFAGGSWGATEFQPRRVYYHFFSFIVFLSFGFLLFILTADPVCFARFLRKRISSFMR